MHMHIKHYPNRPGPANSQGNASSFRRGQHGPGKNEPGTQMPTSPLTIGRSSGCHEMHAAVGTLKPVVYAPMLVADTVQLRMYGVVWYEMVW